MSSSEDGQRVAALPSEAVDEAELDLAPDGDGAVSALALAVHAGHGLGPVEHIQQTDTEDMKTLPKRMKRVDSNLFPREERADALRSWPPEGSSRSSNSPPSLLSELGGRKVKQLGGG